MEQITNWRKNKNKISEYNIEMGSLKEQILVCDILKRVLQVPNIFQVEKHIGNVFGAFGAGFGFGFGF